MDIDFINMLNDLAVDDFIKRFANDYSLVIEDGAITEALRKE